MVNSCYRKANESEVISRMILALLPQLRAADVEVFCDSKAAHSYLRQWSLPSAIAKRLDAGGYQGLRRSQWNQRVRSFRPGLCIAIDPSWL
jgi:hypothetical protein